jgi:hypothetical protein
MKLRLWLGLALLVGQVTPDLKVEPTQIAPAARAVGAHQPAGKWEIYAIRFGVLPSFQVSGLVAGADSSRRLDIPVMVWLLKGSNGRNVLVDSIDRSSSTGGRPATFDRPRTRSRQRASSPKR